MVCGKSAILDAYRRWGHEFGSIEKTVADCHGGADNCTDGQHIPVDVAHGAGRRVWPAGGHRSGAERPGLRAVRLCDVPHGPEPDGYALAFVSRRLHDSETVYGGDGH